MNSPASPSNYSKTVNPSADGSFDWIIDEVNGIGKYFNVGTPQELLDTLLSNGEPMPKDIADSNKPLFEVKQVVKDFILNVTRGALTTPKLMEQIKRTLSNAEKDFVQVMQINAGPQFADLKLGSKESINEVLGESDVAYNTEAESSTTKPTLSSMMIFAQGLSPAVSNTAGLTLFFNAVPPVEMARSLPYLEVNVQVAQKFVEDDGRLNAPGLVKFIMGAAKVSGTGAEILADVTDVNLEFGEKPSGVENTSTFGMEGFLMPQTLAPYGEDSPTLRATPVLDPFRPIASIQSLNLKVVNSGGAGSYKNGQLVLLIHDRSRVHELAYFIKPDLYSTTRLMIEYGWIHPENDYTRNPWGTLINNMRCREKYGITNIAFNMEDTGQMTVTLDIHMLGGLDLIQSKITDSSEKFNTSLKNLESIQARIAELIERKKGKFKDGTLPTKGVFANSIFDSVVKTQGTIDTKKLKDALDRAISNLGNSDELNKQIKEALKKYKEVRDEFAKELENEINRKFDRLKGQDTSLNKSKKGQLLPSAGIDPYLESSIGKVLKEPGVAVAVEVKKVRDEFAVSFGKVFMSFIATPLMSTNKFDDVQVIFYKTNTSAGKQRSKNIASFPMQIGWLRKNYEKIIKEKRTPNMTVGEFVRFVTTYYFDNFESEAYGLSEFYEFDEKEERSVLRKKLGKGKQTVRDPDKINSRLEAKLEAWGTPNFKPIQLEVMLETVPESTPQGTEGKPPDVFTGKNILRIHVFDKAATAYQGASDLMNAAKAENLGMLTFTKKDKENNVVNIDKDETKKIIDAAIKADVLEKIDTDTPVYDEKYSIKGGHQAVKEFVMSTVPYLVYGSQNSIVESLGLSSMQNPGLSTVNIIRAPNVGYITPNGSGKGGVPLRTTPVQLGAVIRGCPILKYMQQFFVDAGTGTDIDNIYAVTGLEHTIEPGNFKTTMTMTPVDAYARFQSAISRLEMQLDALEKAANSTSA